MVTVITNERECNIPDRVKNLDAFLEWRNSDEVPERSRICWLQGLVWVDLEMEEIFSHVLVKTEYTRSLGTLVKNDRSGLFLTDGVLIANADADLSAEPDGLFVSHDNIDKGLVEFIEGAREGYTVLQGSPDMVLEIVSRRSVIKDTVTLRKAYWEAGIKEYWLVDARKAPASFDILRQTSKGYQAVRKQDGWIKSAVFGKSFKLTQTLTDRKLPECSLEVR